MNIVHEPALAEELAQLSFVTAFERLHQFKGDAKFSTWVCQIAFNKCRDYLRAQHHQETFNENNEAHVGLSPDNPENALSAQQSKQQLTAAMGKLKPAEREIVTLKYLCGYSYDLIAQILGCTQQAAKVRSFRAREALKTKLINMGINHG